MVDLTHSDIASRMGLSEEQFEELYSILRFLFPKARLSVFGSRATGQYRPTSDIDILVDAGEPVDMLLLGKARGFLSASNLPMRVDIVDWQRIDDDFRNVIEQPLELPTLPKDHP